MATNFNGPGPSTVAQGHVRDIINKVKVYSGYDAVSHSSRSDRSERKPIHFNLKPPVTSFIGRHHELKEIQKHLQYEKGETSTSTFAIIIGVGGTGKTELARKYAHENSKYYTNIVWVDSETSGTMRSVFETLAETLGIIKNEEKTRIKDHLGEKEDEQKYRIDVIITNVYECLSESKTLLIFDNAEGYGTIEQFIKENLKNIHFLFTSQVKGWTVMDEDITFNEIYLEDLLPEHAKEFVKKSLNQKEVVDEDIEKLIEELACFPLALTQAVAYINQQHQNSLKLRSNKGYGIGNYLKELRVEAKKLLDHENTIHHRYANTVFKTIQLIFEKLSKEKNGKEAVDVLTIIAYLAPDDIHIFKMFKVDENTVMLLDKYSMIKIIEGVASIHRLLQQVIRLRNQDKEIEKLKKALITVSEDKGLDESIYLNHVMFVWTHAIKHKVFIQKVTSYRYTYRNYFPLKIFILNNNFEAIDFMLANIPVEKLKRICNYVYFWGGRYDFPLILAIEHKCSLNIVKLLVQKGSDVGFRELWSAISYKINFDVLKYLIENGAQIIAKDDNGENLLQLVVSQRHNIEIAKCQQIEIVKFLIENGAKPNPKPNAKNKSYETPLHQAIYSENLEIVKYLIENGANVNPYVGENNTPLHSAIDFHVHCQLEERNDPLYQEISKYLSENGDNVNPYVGENNTPLHSAIDLHVHCQLEERNENPLHRDASNETLEIVKCLIKNGAEVNAKDIDGKTALHKAVYRNYLEIAKLLIENGADVNAKDIDGKTALHKAVYRNYLEIAKLLIENGADVNAKNINGRTALYFTFTSYGYLEMVKFLIENGAEVNAKDIDGKTALHEAVYRKYLEIAKLLIENGADVNVKDINGRTALHKGVYEEFLEIAKLLIENGAEVNAKDIYGKTAVHIFTSYRYLEMVKFLIENGAEVNAKDIDGKTALHEAVYRKYLEIAKLLIENGADVNVKDINGRTALHKAVYEEYLDMVKFLIKNGAEVNAKDIDGKTALHEDVYEKYLEIAKLLIENGADVNVKDINGRTALQKAVYEEYLEIAKLLIENGADVNAKYINGRTALHIFTSYGYLKMVKFLIENGAEVNAKDYYGETALHEDVYEKYLEIVKLLIENGADVNAKYINGRTALHIFTSYGYLEMVKFLIENGAEVNAKDIDGKTALHEAVYEKYLEIAKLLIENGADVNVKDNYGKTPLHSCYSIDMLLLLVQNGSDVNAKDDDGGTALHDAAYHNDHNRIVSLLEYGADVNANDKNGKTPLDEANASPHKDQDVIDCLINSGAYITAEAVYDNQMICRIS